MTRPSPTEHASFVRHTHGVEKLDLSHKIILRRIVYNQKDGRLNEEILCEAHLNRIPSFFFVDKERFGSGGKYDIKFTFYLLDNDNYVVMVSECRS